MFLIDINNILSIWTINYYILYIPDIDELSICNIYKGTFVYMTYGKISILGVEILSLPILYTEIFLCA